MSKPAATNPEKITCVPRRHISNAAFKTYDAMVAMCGGTAPMTCYASATKLANWNSRNVDAEYAGLAELEKEGWIVPTHTAPRRRNRAGTFTTNEYRVLTHEEFVAAHPGSCPPAKYDEEGRPIKKQDRPPRSLERANLRRFFGERTQFLGELGNQLLDAIADAIYVKKSTTENPVTVTATESSVVDKPTVTENPVAVTPTYTENPVTTVTESSVATVTENPVTSLDVKPEKESMDRQPNQPSFQNALSENEKTGRTDRTASLALSSSFSTKNDTEWQELLDGLKKMDDEVRGWVLYGETEKNVRRVVKEYGADAVLLALDEWKDNRRPPATGLDHPWPVFLREAEDEIKGWAAANRHYKERKKSQ